MLRESCNVIFDIIRRLEGHRGQKRKRDETNQNEDEMKGDKDDDKDGEERDQGNDDHHHDRRRIFGIQLILQFLTEFPMNLSDV